MGNHGCRWLVSVWDASVPAGFIFSLIHLVFFCWSSLVKQGATRFYWFVNNSSMLLPAVGQDHPRLFASDSALVRLLWWVHYPFFWMLVLTHPQFRSQPEATMWSQFVEFSYHQGISYSRYSILELDDLINQGTTCGPTFSNFARRSDPSFMLSPEIPTRTHPPPLCCAAVWTAVGWTDPQVLGTLTEESELAGLHIELVDHTVHNSTLIQLLLTAVNWWMVG